MRNFGDDLNRLVVPELTGHRAVWSPIEAAELVVIGSVLDTAATKGFSGRVLGAGVRDPETLADGLTVRAKVLGVRGVDSARALGVSSRLAIGDPGLIVSAMFTRTRGERRPAVLPHFGVVNTAEGRRALSGLRARGYKVILPSIDPAEVAAEISSSSFLLTSSLHGLIFAHSYGVPVQLVDFQVGGYREPMFKYRDYLSIFEARIDVLPLDEAMRSGPARVAELMESAECAGSEIDRRLHSVMSGIYAAASALI